MLKSDVSSILVKPYLGFLVNRDGTTPNLAKVEPIKEYPTPKNLRDLRKFQDMAFWYRRFIADYATIAEPLTPLIRKNQKFECLDEQQSAFELLKAMIMLAPTLQRLDPNSPFVVQTDATNAPVGMPHVSPQDALATRHRGPIPAGYPRTVKDVAVQTEALLPIEPTWDELRDGLVNARALDLAATRARSEVLEALDRYAETCAEPHPEATYWRRMATAKREEVDHLVAWRAERRARIQREREAEEAQLRVTTERAMEEARTHRLAEEAELQAVRARWEAARRDEERAAAELGLAEERPQPA